MESSASTSEAVGELDWLLTSFVDKVPDVTHALTVSADGLALAASRGLANDRADQLAAITSGLASLTTGAAKVLNAGRIRQSVVDMDDGVLLLMSVGDRAQVLVLAESGCDLGQVGFETAVLVKRVYAAIEPAARD
ncbi:roadblock/LC7 domain-containing protein [Natronoglycomyces albus]|uniref:Roadblock/LC7 domain-containing protein n=1 Tax=Natronoglycomyces albus TaxID=2811108 RepID=A0A895XJD9_9ACTN|nr:roadblock/LC7 domain-containing protein [Natronoglycomyces albus]QSB05891.1 roadblock/LC7 domain-containing protein [Natronoglycomyces albus]